MSMAALRPALRTAMFGQGAWSILRLPGLVGWWRFGTADARNYVDSQHVADISGRGLSMQRGSTAGVDANDFGRTTTNATFASSYFGIISSVPGPTGNPDFSVWLVCDRTAAAGSDNNVFSYGQDSSSLNYQGFGLSNDGTTNRLALGIYGARAVSALNFPTSPAFVLVRYAAATRAVDYQVAASTDTQTTTHDLAIPTSTRVIRVGVPLGFAATGGLSGNVYEAGFCGSRLSDASAARLYAATKAYWATQGVSLT